MLIVGSLLLPAGFLSLKCLKLNMLNTVEALNSHLHTSAVPTSIQKTYQENPIFTVKTMQAYSALSFE